MAQPIKNLWDAACATEQLHFSLETFQTALDLWYEAVEREAPPEKDAETWRYINFAERCLMYLAQLRCIQTDLAQRVQELLALSDDLYTAARAERERERKVCRMLKAEIENGKQTITANGSGADLVLDISILIGSIHGQLLNSQPQIANAFRRHLLSVLTDPKSGVWDVTPSAGTGFAICYPKNKGGNNNA